MVAQQITLPDVWDDSTSPPTGRWVYKEVLGEGGFGVVHHAIDMQKDRKPVAIKILRCGKDGYRHCLLGTKEVRQARQFQEKVYSKTKHRLFLQYIEDHTGLDIYNDEELRVFEQPDFDWESDDRVKALRKNSNPYLVMELIRGRCVKVLTKERKLSFGEIRELMHQASAALWHLYKQQKIHRDFRVHNMMWHEGKLTIIDFGLVLSAEPQHAQSKNRLVRTYWKLDSYWMPPEVKKPQLKSQQSTFVPYNFAKNCPSSFDMYSFGVMALELLLDSSVNAKMARNQNAIEGKGQKRLRPLDAVKFTDEAKLKAVGLSRHILNLCCARNPAHRPTPEMLLKGFQSEFPQGPPMSAGKESFFRHLHQACGQQRAEKGMKLLGYLAREIVVHASNIEDYVDAMLIFANEPNVSIYRLLCIVDCACRSGTKWATAPNTMELVIGSFAKVIKRMMEAARRLYAADTPSNKFNRHKVIEFAKKWKEMKLFERPFGKNLPAPVSKAAGKTDRSSENRSKAAGKTDITRVPTDQEKIEAAKRKVAAHAAKKVAAAAAADALNEDAKVAPAPIAVEEEEIALSEKDHVVSCQSIGSIGSWSSFTVSALTVKSAGPPDVDVVSSGSDDGVVEVASHTADVSSDNIMSEECETSDSDSSSVVARKAPVPGGIADAWWMEHPDDTPRYTNPKKRVNGRRGADLANKWFIEDEEPRQFARKKIVRRREIETSDESSSESSVKPKLIPQKRGKSPVIDKRRQRLSSLPPPTRRRESPTSSSSSSRGELSSSCPRSRSRSPPLRRNKPRNCLADSDSDTRSKRGNVVLVPRRANSSLFPKFPESRGREDRRMQVDNGPWRSTVPWKR